jgi:hypothetical protein
MANAELDELILADAEGLRAWLSASPATSSGVGGPWPKGGMVTTLT